ncbi:MAG: glycosyltransferase family 2 protein [Pseudanabaenaceae cyanobacterium bins.39]|nr:glycosyltransferase family 2 protein [Pseudanabaenaceae cyanobacterium bins.39]
MVKVSVIVPVYNVERFIKETITSVLAQTFQDFELIIVDDQSPDRSMEICEQFHDPRIRIIHQKNRGLAGARNTGIRHAQGEYIALLDSDDLWLPTKLEKHIQHLEANPKVGISFSRSAFIDEDSNSLGTYQMPKLTDIDAPHLLCRNPIGNGSAPVIRRKALEDIKFQDNLYGEMEDFYFDDQFRQSEDIECWIRIAIQTNWQIEGIPEPLTLYRVNSGSLSANMNKQLESWEKVIAKTRTYAPALLAKWESLARAYQLRYLSRRAIRNKDGKAAVNLVNQALACNWKILIYEPMRSLLTLLAAYLIWLLPRSWYDQIEKLALNLTGASQRKTIGIKLQRSR